MAVVEATSQSINRSPKRTKAFGPVKSELVHFSDPIQLSCGEVLPEYDLMVETYGKLNLQKSNAILVCHALTGNHHAAGYCKDPAERPGWWDEFIGPGKAIDTDQFFVVSLNNLGGCSGSSGPISKDPNTDEYYGPTFPVVTVSDWVNSQARLADRLGIECWAAVIGGSIGGMQSLEWSIRYPERLRHAIIIASSPVVGAQNIALNEVARQCVLRDPEYKNGDYLKYKTFPNNGLAQARMLGHITYLSSAGMNVKFGRRTQTKSLNYQFSPEFEVERYLEYQGERFCKYFDANSYLLMTKAFDYFDPAAEHNQDLVACVDQTKANFLVVAFSSDWLFPPKRSVELVNALKSAGKRVSYACIDSDAGHDSFLLPVPQYVNLLTSYLKEVIKTLPESENGFNEGEDLLFEAR